MEWLEENSVINSILTGVPLHKHKHVHMLLFFLPQASFSCFYFWELFLSLQKRGNIPNYIRSLGWAIELRMGESISLQNRRTKRVCICGWSVCMCVRAVVCVCVWLSMYMRWWRSALYASAHDWVRVHFCLRETLTAWRLCSKVQTGKQMALLSVT